MCHQNLSIWMETHFWIVTNVYGVLSTKHNTKFYWKGSFGSYLHNTLRKNLKFHLIFWCGNFAEMPKTLRKLCISTKFPHQKIRLNFAILRSGIFCAMVFFWYHSVKISMWFQERTWCAALFNSSTREWRESIDWGLEFGFLLTDLSKAFDCLPHDFFVAKLFASGFDDKALRFKYDYLRHRKQRNKIADSYSSWQEGLYGVSQGSILGPLLFNADLCDLFITMSQYDIANYADDNTPYVSGRNIKEVVAALEEVSEVIFQWFR